MEVDKGLLLKQVLPALPSQSVSTMPILTNGVARLPRT